MKEEKVSAESRRELAEWLRTMATPIGGWKVFHTAGFIPSSRLGWAWQPGVHEIPGNAPSDEWETMDRYRRFMHEKARRKFSWVGAVERNPDWSGVNKGWHVHSMWASDDEIYRTSSFKRWANQWGVNKVKSIVGDDAAVAAYLGKYALDELCMVEWEVNGDLWHRQRKLAEMHPAFGKFLCGGRIA